MKNILSKSKGFVKTNRSAWDLLELATHTEDSYMDLHRLSSPGLNIKERTKICKDLFPVIEKLGFSISLNQIPIEQQDDYRDAIPLVLPVVKTEFNAV